MDIHIGVDVGGTFTDIAVSLPAEGRLVRHKVPSTPAEPHRAIREGIEQALAAEGLSPSGVVRLSHGTTVGTNALIQRRIGRVAVVTTAGFRDLLEIGRQVRPKVYDIHMDNPPPLVPRELRFEVGERLLADGSVHRPLDEAAVRAQGLRIAQAGVDVVVVCFLHSYANPAHEQRAVAILREVLPDGVQVLASTSVYPEFREYERFSTAVLNGALITVIDRYLDRFGHDMAALGLGAPPRISHSSGGLMSIEMARRLPIRASLSGPAAGVLGCAARARAMGRGDVIALDVGGTSADVALLRGGTPSEVHFQLLEGFPLRLPALDVAAVGAGGGSIAWIDRDELLKVGPHSAGADPGPACYGQGGTEATVTDANVVLGRLNGQALLDGRMPIRKELAEEAVARLARRLGLGLLETAQGIARVACATIVRAIRRVSVERAHDPAGFALFAYGGAGPLLAGDIARELGIRSVVVPPSPGILCAEGLQNCDLSADFVQSALVDLAPGAPERINRVRAELQGEVLAWFEEEAVPVADRALAWTVDLRYRGQNFELALPVADAPLGETEVSRLAELFHAAHERAYGFAFAGEPIEFVNMKVKATGLLEKPALPRLGDAPPGRPTGERRVLFAGEAFLATPVYRRDDLARGQRLEGPLIVEQLDATTLVHPGDLCTVDEWGNLVIAIAEGEPS